jgi:hypothetical protein
MKKQTATWIGAIGLAILFYYLYKNGTVNNLTGGQYGPPAPSPGTDSGGLFGNGGFLGTGIGASPNGTQYGPPAPTDLNSPVTGNATQGQVILLPLLPMLPARTCTLTFPQGNSSGAYAEADCILDPADVTTVFSAFPSLKTVKDYLGITHNR